MSKKFYSLLDQLKNEGINLYGVHNSSIDSMASYSVTANRFAVEYLDRDYILGNVLADTEHIEDVPYFTLFHAIESHIGLYKLPTDKQKEVHSILDSYQYGRDSIKAVLKGIRKECGKQYREYFNRVADTFNDFMKDITKELAEMLEDVQALES